MKRLPRRLLLSISLIALAVVIASLMFRGTPSLIELDGVAKFVDSQHYNSSQLVKDLFNTDTGQGKVLLPELKDGVHNLKTRIARQTGFVGPESCRKCHPGFYDGFVETAHYRTSSLPTSYSVLGTFDEVVIAELDSPIDTAIEHASWFH